MADPLQLGAVPGSGTAFPAMAIQCFLREGSICRAPRGVIIFDITAAFYTVPVEAALGALMTSGARHAALRHAGLSDSEITEFEEAYFTHGSKLLQAGLDQRWLSLLCDWSSNSWFAVRDGSNKIWTRLGVKPCDPLADLIFALSFFAFQISLLLELQKAGIHAEVTLRGDGIFAKDEPTRSVPLATNTYLDDLAVLVVAKE